MARKILTDDQPIDAGFFRQGQWLTDYITPNSLEIQELHAEITEGIRPLEDRLIQLWYWVATEVRYKEFIRGTLSIDGKISSQKDLWMMPSLTKQVKIGNCANKSFLLTSLLRNELTTDQVHCVLGNLYNGKPGGHAWVQIHLYGHEYIMEPTDNQTPFVQASVATRYEPVHLFNDSKVWTVSAQTQLLPFTACYSSWLKDYLDWAYIEGGGRK